MQSTMNYLEYRETTTETKDQIALAELLDKIKYNGRPLRWCHIPNEGKRNPITGKNLKRQGLKPGMPDNLIFDIPPHYHGQKGAVIELKRLKGGVLSEAQNDWLLYFATNGWLAKVCEGIDEAIDTLREWGYIK